MKRRWIAAVVGVLASGALIGAGVAEAGTAAATRVTIRGPNGDFQGKIFSENHSCLGDRRVTLFEQQGDEPDPSVDDRLGSDTSEQQGTHGEWSMGNTGFRDGFFYVKVARSPGCRGARSKTIELQDGVPQ